MPYDNVALLVAWLSVTTFLYHIISTYQHLAQVPGPFWSRITNLPRVLWVKSGRAHEIHQKLHETHGPVVRLGPNMVSVSDPEAIPLIYPIRGGLLKSDFYGVQRPYTRKDGSVPAIFNTQDENLHKQLRKPVASMYSMTNIVGFEPLFDQTLSILFQQLDKRFVETKSVFDLCSWLQYYAYDVMGSLTFSKQYGFLKEGKDVNGILRAVERFMDISAPMGQVPWLDRFLFKNPIAAGFQKTSGSTILELVNHYISERVTQLGNAENQVKQHHDMLSHFLWAQETHPTIPRWAPKAWTFANVKAGSDSTANTMQTIFYYLLTHPISLDRLIRELMLCDGQTTKQSPILTWNQLRKLPYLDACFMEALRLHPAFCLPLERVVPACGVTICKRHLPQGTVVGMSPFVVNRDQALFGTDAADWRPERWVGVSPEQRRNMERAILTFGSGHRSCLGKNVAIVEVKKTVSALLRRYEIQIIDAKRRKTENSWLFRQWGLDVVIKRR